MIAFVNPTAVPALTMAGIFFITINLLASAYIIRHWQLLFGPDARVDGDRAATRALQVIVLTVPLLFITFRLVFELVGLWIK